MELSAEAYTAWQDEAQRKRLLMDQLPQVRYIARRIHEHLRGTSLLKTWCMLAWWA